MNHKPYAYSLTIRRLALSIYVRLNLPCPFPKRTEEEANRIGNRVYFRANKLDHERN